MDAKTLKIFESNKILLKNLKTLEIAEFSKSRVLSGYFGIDLKGFYNIIFIRAAKSRFLLKDAISLNELCKKYEEKFNTNIKKRMFFYNSQICSKAINELKNTSWKCHDFM